jgi:sugar phosphate permease
LDSSGGPHRNYE